MTFVSPAYCRASRQMYVGPSSLKPDWTAPLGRSYLVLVVCTVAQPKVDTFAVSSTSTSKFVDTVQPIIFVATRQWPPPGLPFASCANESDPDKFASAPVIGARQMYVFPPWLRPLRTAYFGRPSSCVAFSTDTHFRPLGIGTEGVGIGCGCGKGPW